MKSIFRVFADKTAEVTGSPHRGEVHRLCLLELASLAHRRACRSCPAWNRNVRVSANSPSL